MARVFDWATREARKNAVRAAVTAPEQIGGATELLRQRVLKLADSAPAQMDTADRLRIAANIERLHAANCVPKMYERACLDGVEKVPQRIGGKAVRERYAEVAADLRTLIENPRIVVMIGNRGPGKTHLACALVNEFCGVGRSAVYAEVGDYFLRLDEAINARSSALKVEEQYRAPALLVLDAMEERADTPAKDRMLTRLIGKRYADEKATVLISNETLDSFKNRVGPSIADRIRDGGTVLMCDWPSLRGEMEEKQ